MTQAGLLAIVGLRALVEIALLFLVGQGVLAILAGSRRHDNGVYRLFVLLTRPVLQLTRFITPRGIIDQHLPVVAFFLLFWCWIGLAWLKRAYAY